MYLLCSLDRRTRGIERLYGERQDARTVRVRVGAGKCLHHEQRRHGNLMAAVLSLRSLPWFAECARDVRGFKVDNWSNFNAVISCL